MVRNPKWIARQIKNSQRELDVDVDSDEDRKRLDRMARIHEQQVAELKANPTMALARITEQKVYFTADELRLAYGRPMKPAVSMDADAANPTAITNYTEVGTDSDKAFLEEVLRIEGHWAHKR